MGRRGRINLAVLALFSLCARELCAAPDAPYTPESYLLTGQLRPAFDHLGEFGQQLDAAVSSRCATVYATGVGEFSYRGLPPRNELNAYLDKLRAYNQRAHGSGVRIMLSYLCATSIVNIKTFDKDWDEYFPVRSTDFEPEQMLQKEINGNNLPSWYGEPYNPADMWNPHWRDYTRFTIKLAVESGHDGVFFDNPTVHPKGNYSPSAMKAWRKFVEKAGVRADTDDLTQLRKLTTLHPQLWQQFRTTESADFFQAMRDYGRSLKPDFVLTANNSLNTWDSFFSQTRAFAYSIPQQSRYEDFITIEDMSSQPRRQGDSFVSYAGTLRMIQAIANDRPLSVCTTDGDYFTPPGLMKLAIAECAAHDASYLVWSCWDEKFRAGSAAAVAQYHRFLADHTELVAHSKPVADLLLIWPYDNWLQRDDCPTATLARELSNRNIQYEVVTEADLSPTRLKRFTSVAFSTQESLQRASTVQMLHDFEAAGGTVLGLAGSTASAQTRPASSLDDQKRWTDVQDLSSSRIPSSVKLEGPAGVRAIVRRNAEGGPILHLYNLDVARVDRYHDKVVPAKDLRVSWLLPRGTAAVERVRLLTPDEKVGTNWVKCSSTTEDGRSRISFVVRGLSIWTIVTLR